MNILKEVVGVIGSIIFVYFGARIAATIGDFYQRALAAKGRPKERIIPQLSFWPELEKLVKGCQDRGDFPLEDPLKIEWTKASPEDLKRLSKIKNPVKAIERQLNYLFASSGVADKMEVRREKNLLYICSTSW